MQVLFLTFLKKNDGVGYRRKIFVIGVTREGGYFGIIQDMKVLFEKLTATACLPHYAHEGDAGMDLCADEACVLMPGERRAVATGLRMQLPPGTEGQVRPRSGLALKEGLTVLNSPGTIDEGYRGELKVILINFGQRPVAIEPGMRIAQLVIAPVLRVAVEEGSITDVTERGAGGFGSSGI